MNGSGVDRGQFLIVAPGVVDVGPCDFGRAAFHSDPSFIEPDHPRADLAQHSDAVTRDDDGSIILGQVFNHSTCSFPKAGIPGCEHFIEQEDVRFDLGCDGEAEADSHPC